MAAATSSGKIATASRPAVKSLEAIWSAQRTPLLAATAEAPAVAAPASAAAPQTPVDRVASTSAGAGTVANASADVVVAAATRISSASRAALTSDTLVLNVCQTAYPVNAQFLVAVNGVLVGGVQTATAIYTNGTDVPAPVTLTGNFGSGPLTVALYFINAQSNSAANLNLFVLSMTLNGQAYSTRGALYHTDDGMAWTLNGTTATAVTAPPMSTIGTTAVANLAITATNATLADGTSGNTAFTFTVIRGGNTSSAASAAWTVAGSGSKPVIAADFAGGVLPSGTVSFAAGQTSQTITVEVAPNTVTGAAQGFTVTLGNPASGTTITTASASGSILPEPSLQAATLAIATAAATLGDGTTGNTAFTFTVTRGGNTGVAASAAWTVAGSGGNPASAADFAGGVLPSGTVSFAAGQTSQTITVEVAPNTVTQAAQGFTVTLGNPASGTTITTASASGSILPEPCNLAIAAAAAVLADGTTGNTAFTFTVTRGGNTGVAASAAWTVAGSGGNPASAADFAGGVLPSGTVSFAAGQTSQTITVEVAPNTVTGAAQGFTVTLGNPASGTTITTASASGSILPEPCNLAIAAAAAVLADGTTGNTAFTFTVTRGGNTGVAASAAWTVAGSGGNPASAADFAGGVLPSGTVSFAAGQTSQTITVEVAPNTVTGAAQGFTVTSAIPHPAPPSPPPAPAGPSCRRRRRPPTRWC